MQIASVQTFDNETIYYTLLNNTMVSGETSKENADKAEGKELLPKQEIDPQEAQMALGSCKEEEPAMSRIILKVYPRRWIVLLVVALLNNINTMSWIAYAPIANHADAFYYQPSAANYFSMVYILCTIPVGIFAMWAGRFFGLRWAILIAAYSNGIGGLIRLASSFFSPDYRFAVGITGQGIAGLAYPFIMFLPTKVAASWFPENQRALATTIGVMSNPLGVIIANLMGPLVVKEAEQILHLNIFTAALSFVILLIATFAVNRSEPKLPPSVSASQPSLEFLKGVKTCFTSREYLVLLVVMGGGIGMFNCLYTIIQQLLCPSGYSNSFSGYSAALMIIGGVFGAAVAGIFVDKTKMYEETMKVSMGLAVIFGIVFLQLVLHRNLGPIILVVCMLFGIFGLATYPVGLEMSAECIYPVSETTSTGLIVISGQIQSIVYLAVMNIFAKPLQPSHMEYQVCYEKKFSDPGQPKDSISPKDMTNSVIVMSIIAATLVIALVFFFHPKYRRMNADKGNVPKANGMKSVDEIDQPADTELDLTIKEPI